MTNKNISIKNIYYMLSYAFKALCKNQYKYMEDEEFDNFADLCAEILYVGILELIKRGINREYIEKRELSSILRGKIEITESINVKTILKRKLSCTYVDFSINSYLNKILKTTLLLLLKLDVKNERKKKLRLILSYFKDVDELNKKLIKWNFNYNRNNQTYEMLISVCYLVINSSIQNDSEGNKKFLHFTHEQMQLLYQRFIFEYYKKELKKLSVTSPQISWGGVCEEIQEDNEGIKLPKMQSDIMLSYNDNILIIDAKYYSKVTQKNIYNSNETLLSHNLYQIFSYVKNKEYDLGKTDDKKYVSGMLLYAKTNDGVELDNTYTICGNKISAKTLNLNCDFIEIKNQLNGIAKDFLGVSL